MKYNNPGYNRLLVGELYHWEPEQDGYYAVKENISDEYFRNFSLNEIMENINE